MTVTVTDPMKDRPEDIPIPYMDGLGIEPARGRTAAREPALSEDDLEHAKRVGRGM